MKETEKKVKETPFSLLEDLGENYHYIKTIVTNNFEIKKLELIQNVSGIISFLLFAFIAMFSLSAILLFLLAALVVCLASMMDSFILALLATSCLLFLFTLVTYVLARTLINNYIEKRILKLTKVI